MRKYLKTVALSVVAVLAWAGAVWAKPLGIVANDVMDRALLIAEVQILEVRIPPATGRGGMLAGDQGLIRLRVTNDPEVVFRGFAMLGQELDLLPAQGGPSGCAGDLRKLADSGERLLVVVTQDRRVILAGQPRDEGGKRIYRLRSWCDYNAWWVWSTDKAFGTSVKLENDWGSMLDVGAQEIRTRYLKEHAEFQGLASAFLLNEPALMNAAEFSEQVKRLGSEEPQAREDAQKALLDGSRWSIRDLREAKARSTELEVQSRLNAILAALALHDAAFSSCEAARGKGPEAEAKMLLAAWPALDAAHRERAGAHWAKLAALRDPAMNVPAGATPEALMEAWKKTLTP
ncbi:MAG: hypothetical protein HS116_18845 [Planctomycetes bacterium]|nr:hypothetical protein [Planctomycetota bacterium]